MPKYMGLRVRPNTPEETSFDVSCGRRGLIVVWARRNEKTAVNITAKPAAAINKAATMNGLEDNWAVGSNREVAHITPAVTNATTGGGTFSSSTRMII